jgi:hypothetical protein
MVVMGVRADAINDSSGYLMHYFNDDLINDADHESPESEPDSKNS